jgi:hypothetical protein
VFSLKSALETAQETNRELRKAVKELKSDSRTLKTRIDWLEGDVSEKIKLHVRLETATLKRDIVEEMEGYLDGDRTLNVTGELLNVRGEFRFKPYDSD